MCGTWQLTGGPAAIICSPMSFRLALLIALTMTAFAANSLLNRLAVDSGAITPGAFSFMRVAAGVAMLGLLAMLRRGRRLPVGWRQLIGAPALAAYMIGFSQAYRTLDAGVGALILFGAVQITMFLFAALSGSPATGRQVAGAAVAFAGLVWILWPGRCWQAEPAGAAMMVAAGIGWGAYTLAGRGEADPVSATAANFAMALPLVALPPYLSGELAAGGAPSGLALAVLSGAVTSGLGYALWYAIVPLIDAAVAALVQLSVPVIALAGGALLLAEAPSPRFLAGTALVLGGIALSVGRRGRQAS